MLHKIESEQMLKADLETVWAFISDPKNLSKITPEYMDFEVLGNENRKGNVKKKGNENRKGNGDGSIANRREADIGNTMYPGQIIEYHVKPIAGIKMHWVTEITHVKDKSYFVDEQRFGPYSFWHHQHLLIPTTEGVLMKDIVHYKLPLGILGKLANALLVKKQLKGIFDYRFRVLEKLYNNG